MELEAVRCVKDWLAGVSTGAAAYAVNTLIPSTPRDAGDAQPPLFATIADSTRDNWVARQHHSRDGGPALPALVVFAEPFDVDGEVATSKRDGPLTVVVAQIEEKSESATLAQNVLYRRRAIVRSLKQFHDNANEAARLRNGIALMVCERMELGGVAEPWQDAIATDAIKLTYLVRDIAP